MQPIAAEEFIRRFLLHVLPEGFQRIRYYGFLANRYREQKLARCRQLLAMPQPEPPDNHAAGDYRDQPWVTFADGDEIFEAQPSEEIGPGSR